MNVETTGDRFPNAWVLYDGDCGLCVNLARRFAKSLTRHRFELLPLQTPSVRERLDLNGPALLSEMRVLLPDGRTFGGADAVVEISRRYWWAWPLPLLARIPPVMTLLRAGYRWFARNRACAANVCPIDVGNKSTNLRPPESPRHSVFFKMP
jgi:predicted DCC family thiol-disulfide oxidoreductase YuxK